MDALSKREERVCVQPEPDRPSAGWLRIPNGSNLIVLKHAKELHVSGVENKGRKERRG
jgi:hypothetical protein